MNAAQAVARGIKVLNEKKHCRWWNKINLKTFDIDCIYNCVLGQLYGNYSKGVDALFYKLFPPYFAVTYNGFTTYTMQDSTPLQKEWKKQLRKLQKERP